MKRILSSAALSLALFSFTLTIGCEDKASTSTSTTSAPSTSTVTDDHAAAPMDAAGAATDEATVKEAAAEGKDDPLAKLTAAERAAVMAQKTCPVSGEELGGMGTPIKVTVDGKDIYVCCESCVEDAKENFAKYLAKIEAVPSDAAAPETN